MKPDQPLPPSDRRSATPSPSPDKSFDRLLDPLPVPDVTESDTDTAWGLWEASVDGLPEDGYERTQPVGLDREPPPTSAS